MVKLNILPMVIKKEDFGRYYTVLKTFLNNFIK